MKSMLRSSRAQVLSAYAFACCVLIWSQVASADPVNLLDRSVLGPVVDGTVNTGEYTAASSGVNTGFGGVIGAGTTLSVESSINGDVVLGLSGSKAGACANDPIVLYIDSVTGGFGTTGAFTDAGDLHRSAISAMGYAAGGGGAGRAELTFAPGFEADYAIALTPTYAGLWKLEATTHTFVKDLNATPATAWADSCNHELSGLMMTDLGALPGDTIKYVATVLNPVDAAGAYRSDEFQGVASSTATSGNLGTTPLVLAAGDFNTFKSVLVLINEIDSDTPGTDVAEFLELSDGGVGGVDLTGLVVVLYNGNGDVSYGASTLLPAIDLDGLVTRSTGLFVIGNAGVAGLDFTVNSGAIQNGQDAVALYLDDATSFPLNTPVTATNLVDAVVYGTGDADDPVLLSVLTPGQPQVDESANLTNTIDSVQRCSGGALVTTGFLTRLATPGAANDCAICGNGTVELGEACDDGNLVPGDACGPTCTLCGNLALDAGEQCEDSNAASADGCSATCEIESGYQCTASAPATCTQVESFCNDGLDDDGDGAIDGLDSDCVLPAYFGGCGTNERLEVYSSVNVPVAIPDGDSNGILNSVSVASNGTLGSTSLLFSIDHTWDSDVDLYLIPPSGTVIEVCTDNGGTGANYVATVLDTRCTTAVTAGIAPFTGCYIPENPTTVTELAGTSATGPWTLRVADDSGLDTGTLLSWSLVLCTSTCGDTVVAGAEQCDDGNNVNGDGCDNNCKTTACGNGVLTAGEGCDDGNTINGDGCDAFCVLEPFCGDGNVDAGEVCDDGNTADGDGCDSNCTLTACGNSIVTAGEACDDGNASNTDACLDTCMAASCGDLFIQAGVEDCEDGNSIADDGCEACAWVTPSTWTCNVNFFADGGCDCGCGFLDADCTDATVGSCQYCANSGSCSSTSCPGTIDLIDNSTCLVAGICGDGTFNLGEECDDANLIDGDGCDSNCTTTACGNGVATTGEGCDDGNAVNGDGCDVNCTVTGCGNLIITAGENCDDGNIVGGDGCDPACHIETVCGDNTLEGYEECEDGNVVDGDGCSAACRIEPGYQCTSTLPNVCTVFEVLCNDGVDNDGDGNLDGADSDCVLPAAFTGCGANETLEVYQPVGLPVTIPDNDATGLTTSVLISSGSSLARAALTFDIAHTWDSDVQMLLSAPNSSAIDVCSGNGGSGDNFTDTVLDTQCTSPISGGTAPFSGCYTPENAASVDALVGSLVDGTWTLKVSDGGSGDIGTLQSWKLALCTTLCGDGVVAGAEVCDDGNLLDGDGCDNNCTVSACGNGVVGGSETCDDGNVIDDDGCDSNCTTTACGNAILTSGEVCDDGNIVDNDGCDSNCTATACGNGVVAGSETCDDGNTADGDGCDGNCTATACGNGVLTAGEVCDDGNAANGDGCDNNCTTTACGNGVVAGTETCDDGNAASGDGCDNNCTVTGCGNGVVTAGETCDDANLTSGDGCDANCRTTACGNGILTTGEVCDDGNLTDGDGCDSNCRATACGNGVATTGETCDDGNLTDGDGCDSNCSTTACGNGIVTTGEACDDGNADNTDACLDTCVAASCGDSQIQTGVETCDDGAESATCNADCSTVACGDGVLNTTAGESCEGAADCSASQTCTGCACVDNATCGDGNIDAGEDCDDGLNNSDTEPDACRVGCLLPSCGDGVIDTDEACDGGVDNSDSVADACRTTCELAFCGDGVIDSTEVCDDGADNSDVQAGACSTHCGVSTCGDGTLDSGEECDAGVDNSNTAPNACRESCLTAFCGDSVVDSGEECDEGVDNSSTGTCSATCAVVNVAELEGEDTSATDATLEGYEVHGSDSCGCRTVGTTSGTGRWAVVLLGLGLLALVRRRRS